MTVRLELCEASYRYDRASDWVFRDVSFSLRPGLYGLFGPNASGKTTLLQCIAGVRAWRNGNAHMALGARALHGKERLERMGYVPQEPAFYEDMSVRTFLTYVARMKLIPEHRIAERITEMLSRLNLELLADMRIDALSTGQRKRLSLAQALLNDPHLLLLDEALEGLDMEERSAVMEMLQELAEGCIIVLAGHLLKEMEPWLEQVMFMANGHVLGPKTPQQWKWLLMHDTEASGTSSAEWATLEEVYLAAVAARSR